MRRLTVALIFLMIGSGCATNHDSARFDISRDLNETDVFFIEQNNDKRNLGSRIADNISKRGFAVTVGPDQSESGNETILVTYDDRWHWDITMFMIELTIAFRDPSTRVAFAVGNSYHSSLTRLTRDQMIEEVLSNIFAADDSPDGFIPYVEEQFQIAPL